MVLDSCVSATKPGDGLDSLLSFAEYCDVYETLIPSEVDP
jgi:hypothetical protein